MTTGTTASWHELNQRYLMEAVRAVCGRLRDDANSLAAEPGAASTVAAEPEDAELSPPAAIDQLCGAFGLSRFERDVLLLCAGVELDASIAALVASVQKRGGVAPTFGLALAAFSDAHWSALSPAAPLRHWRLIEVGAGETLSGSPLRIDERILHYLAGVPQLDERLRGMLDRVERPDEVTASEQAQAEQLAKSWRDCDSRDVPLLQIHGGDSSGRRVIAAATCAAAGADLCAMDASKLPQHPAELDAFARLWQREAVLARCGLLIEIAAPDPVRDAAVAWLSTQLRGLLILSEETARRSWPRVTIACEVPRPTRAEQAGLWRHCLGEVGVRLNGELDAINAQFDLGAGTIREAAARIRGNDVDVDATATALWKVCREQTRPKLEGLAQRIDAAATWADLVLPADQIEVLREVAVQVRRRTQVYEEWGFAAHCKRGLGITALFSGASGTGKTMAAEVLANELRLDLYRIDLSQVVSKYIGETEKNLRRVFDAAEQSCGILLFDEADALFGKRSEVKDSHDRYANVEISYLLQRMEAYGGLAILTTNLQGAIDTAFLRRLRFIVRFPFPDAAQRAEIWRRSFPHAAPTEGLDFARLGRLQVAGGNIRNISLQAAFLAADIGEPVQMSHLLRAARSEYAKLDRSLTTAETGDWR